MDARWIEYDEPEFDERVVAYAKEHGIEDIKALDWHLEAAHGWERHDKGYEDRIPEAAACLARGGC